MFPFLEMIFSGLMQPEMLAQQMAVSGITPQMMERQLVGVGNLAQPQVNAVTGLMGSATNSGVAQGLANGPGAQAAITGQIAEVAAKDPDLYHRFMSTVQQQVKNPNALAAIAATGDRESQWSPGNVFGTWDDVGKPSGGALSWRDDRLNNMLQGRSIKETTPEYQANYLIDEGKRMGYLERLEQAQSPEEAMEIMNNAWRFKGYDNPEHPETQARFEAAKKRAIEFNNLPGTGATGNVGSTIDFARAGGSTPTPAITPGGEQTQIQASMNVPIGGGLDTTTTGAASTTMEMGVPRTGLQPNSLGGRLAQLGAGLKGGGGNGGSGKGPLPTAPGSSPSVGGGYSRDPQAIENLMMLLGAAGPALGGSAIPSLAAMINPKG